MTGLKARGSILGLIPARLGSKGIPGKNIKKLGDLPLIAHTCRAALKSQIDRVVVSTDCHQIAEVARQYGGEVPFIRPSELAEDDTPTRDVITHLLRYLEESRDSIPEMIVLLQPTSPFRTAADIDSCLEKLRDSRADSVISVCEVPAHYNSHWQFYSSEGNLKLTTGEALRDIVTRRQSLPSTFIRNGAVYCFRVSSFEQMKSIYGETCLGHTMSPERSINLDTLEDWRAAEQLIATQSCEVPYAA